MSVMRDMTPNTEWRFGRVGQPSALLAEVDAAGKVTLHVDALRRAASQGSDRAAHVLAELRR